MFTKYLGKFKKAEAEWVLEVLDMNDGDYEKAKQAVMDSLNRIIGNAELVDDLKWFDDTIRGSFFANRDWWVVGIERLEELGIIEKIKRPEVTT